MTSRQGNGVAAVALAVASLGMGLVLAADDLYGYGFVAAIAALATVRRAAAGSQMALRRDGRTLSGGLLVGAVLIAGATGITGVAASFGLDDGAAASAAAPASAAAERRDDFCASDPADELARLAGAGIDVTRSAELVGATDAALKLAGEAPPGAPCVVLALDAIADSWIVAAGEPGFRGAREQVRRIREFQRRNGLRRAAF